MIPATTPSLSAVSRLRHAARAGRRRGDSRFDVLYRVYVTTLLGLFGFYLVLGLVDDLPVDADTVARISSKAPAWGGAAAVISVALGLRSGARGGPLAIDELELHHVLLAPVDRAVVLRHALRRLALVGGGLGVVFGAAAGELASRRLPGPQLQWVAGGALSGTGMVLLGIGAAAFAAGRRLDPRIAVSVSLGLIGMVSVTMFVGLTSPLDGFGHVALWPLGHHPDALVGVVGPPLMFWFGYRSIGGLSLEQAHRRTRLVAQVRFALAQQDIRSLLLLRRQLDHETPRARPWLVIEAGGRIEDRLPVLVRDARSYSRWPLSRLLRVGGLAVVSGLALAGMWAGTTALIGLTGGAIYLAAIEVVEPFSQELDHPALLDSIPALGGSIMLWHLISGTIAMTIVWVLAGLTAMIATLSLTPGAVVAIGAIPAAAAATAAAGLSIRRIGFGIQGLSTPDELAGPQMLLRLLWPPALALLGAIPVLSARNAMIAGRPVVPSVLGSASLVCFVASAAAVWIRFRDDLAAAAGQAGQRP